jgi:mannose-6-phosphate isomerase-like protein (cupin superfamily)
MSERRPATIVGPEDGAMFYVVGDRYRFLANREDTNGRYAIWEAVVPPGGGPPPHVHTREEEGFYVIEGEVLIHVEGQQVRATAGSFVNMPVGSTHWFRNESDRPARMLILAAPGGLEAMFRKMGVPVSDTAAPFPPPIEAEIQRLLATAPEFGIEIKLPGAPSPHS